MENLFEANKSILKSMLLDEEKLITYISLSKDLCVHINDSKMLLRHIVDHVRQETPDIQLNVTYIISGTTENNKARTVVCSEQDLNKVKQCFVNTFFKHIYSISKGNPGIDTLAYLTVNKFEDFVLCSGLIKSKQCEKRTLDEIGNLKSNSQEVLGIEKSKSLPVSLKNIRQETNITNNSHTEVKLISKDKNSQSEPIVKQDIIASKKEVVKPFSNGKLSNDHKTQKGIAGFFNKTPNCNNKHEVNGNMPNVGKIKVEINGVKSEKNDIKLETDEEEKHSNNKILNQIKKSSKVDKKRKRVLHVSDSDSDSEINNPFTDNCVDEQKQIVNDSEDEIPSTPTVNNIVIKSGIANPKKRRKVVDKTFTDDDGYILTKKVEVYESCSENEEPAEAQEKALKVEVKSEVSPKGKNNGLKKKISPPQKGKQPTLTNFFKKI